MTLLHSAFPIKWTVVTPLSCFLPLYWQLSIIWDLFAIQRKWQWNYQANCRLHYKVLAMKQWLWDRLEYIRNNCFKILTVSHKDELVDQWYESTGCVCFIIVLRSNEMFLTIQESTNSISVNMIAIVHEKNVRLAVLLNAFSLSILSILIIIFQRRKWN